jgi:ArsR family transcriptional regulator, arsenate/arsenite/antimonite-responsive transcriptional repressor
MKQFYLAKKFKALSCEQRLKLFMMIYDYKMEALSNADSASVGGVDKAFTKACNHFNLARSTISHHLKALENAGLISTTRNGQSFTCTINMDAVKEIQEFLK